MAAILIAGHYFAVSIFPTFRKNVDLSRLCLFMNPYDSMHNWNVPSIDVENNDLPGSDWRTAHVQEKNVPLHQQDVRHYKQVTRRLHCSRKARSQSWSSWNQLQLEHLM
jgi:hypothetical protein